MDADVLRQKEFVLLCLLPPAQSCQYFLVGRLCSHWATQACAPLHLGSLSSTAIGFDEDDDGHGSVVHRRGPAHHGSGHDR